MDNNNNNNTHDSTNSEEVIKQDDASAVEVSNEQILTFVDDQDPETFIIPLDKNVLSTFDNQGLESREHTVRDFLSRPMKIGQFEWSSSQSRNDQIFGFSFPSALFNQPMIAEKIAGFVYLRGDIHISLQINSQNFQAGMFQLRYFPVLSPSQLYNSQLDSMKQFSGLPGTDVNLQENSPMKIQIPFIYPNDVYDILTTPDDWAQAYARVYSPLRAASATTVSVTVWAHFDKDTLDLSMPTSSVSPTLAKTLLKHYTKRVAELQIGKEQKVASKAGGPVSGIANVVSNVASVASGIPGLGAISGVVGTVSNIVGGLASMFGFSKPTSNQTITQIKPTFVRGMANSDFPDSASQTALITDNSLIEAKPMYRTDVDEMSLDFMVRVPHFIDAFDYNAVDPENKLIYSLEINPARMTSNISGANLITTTSMGLVSSCFELWRGSINVTFKFSKTQFHSGRLIFVWFNSEIVNVPPVYQIEYAMNPAIQLDLHDKYEIDINIPYIQSTPWLNIHSSDTKFKSSNGYLAVYIINKLQAAPSASSSIECVVEARAGSDFEVAIPKSPELLGYWINPQATNLPPSFDYIVVTDYTKTDNTYGIDIKVPWGPSITLAGNGSGESVSAVVAPANTFARVNNAPGPGFQDVNISGNILTFTCNQYFTDIGPIITITGDLVGQISDRVLPFSPEDVPANWILVYTPIRRKAQLQISRDESYLGVDGISILGSVTPQTVLDVNKDTVGEVVKSIRPLLKRYQPDNNIIKTHAFDRDFAIINPDNFSSLGVPSASYISLFYPAYRFWRGSRRYKYCFNSDGIDQQLYPVYLLPNYNSDLMSFDPRDKTLSTNLFYNFFEGALEISIPYYNRNRITITGDVTDDRLLSPLHKRLVIDFLASVTYSDALLYSNVGEDFSFGMWLGAPTLVGTIRT